MDCGPLPLLRWLRAQKGALSDIDENTVAYQHQELLGVVGQIIPCSYLILIDGSGGTFSLEGNTGKAFHRRARLFTHQEWTGIGPQVWRDLA